jgi:hypothetical protein
MNESDLETLIGNVCHDVGKIKGIEFQAATTRGLQVPGSWESDYRLRRQGHSTVILTYWFSVDMLLREEVILAWAFPPTSEESEKFKSDLSAKIDQMLKWL